MKAKYLAVQVGRRVVAVHILRAERAYGGRLPAKAIVHHADGTTDPLGPLVICQDQRYHKLLHVRMRVKALGGDPNSERQCFICKGLVNISDSRKNPAATVYRCKPCDNADRVRRKWEARRRAGVPMIAKGRSLALMNGP